MRRKIHLITLGCPKNISDSEVISKQLKLNDIDLVDKPDGADGVLINTCGFIQDAKEESLETIFEMIKLKKRGLLKKVYVMGCLFERYRNELKEELSEVDSFYGVKDFEKIIKEIGGQIFYNKLYQHDAITLPHYSYLKISDGCNHACSFCAIPHIKGKHSSKKIEFLVKEAESLVENGAKELIIIAQDTTYYGKDLYGRNRLADLLKKIVKVKNLDWIRLMYAFPSQFPLEILDILLDNLNFCKYIDLPVQHISNRVLKSMRRGITKINTLTLIDKIRKKVPNIAIRTSIIVGYPEERESDFLELLKFVEEIRFERLGVFTYSKEEGTLADKLKDRIPIKEKLARKDMIMETQRMISLENNKNLMKKELKVLIDTEDKNCFFGRTEWDAPEIDNQVIIKKKYCAKEVNLIGNFITAKVYNYNDYDLYAKQVIK